MRQSIKSTIFQLIFVVIGIIFSYDSILFVSSQDAEPICPVEPNGCGSAGGIDYVADSFVGGYSFETACNTHDLCYSTLSADKASCDKKFLEDMQKVCETIPADQRSTGTTLDRNDCFANASLYYNAVDIFGDDAYESAQTHAQQCEAISATPQDVISGGSGTDTVEGGAGDGQLLSDNFLDLIFVIDTTGSMRDDINEVQRRAIDIINQVAASGSDWRIALVTYRDHPRDPYGDPGDYVSRLEVGFSSNQADIINAINGIQVGGGGDGPEAMYARRPMTRMCTTLAVMLTQVERGKQLLDWLKKDASPHEPSSSSLWTKPSMRLMASLQAMHG